MKKKTIFLGLLLSLGCIALIGQKPKVIPPQPPVSWVAGKLVYRLDEQGDRLPDFSYSGYASGEKAIPNLPIKVVVPPMVGDATERIQSAIDYVAALKPDANGFRGCVLLQKGIYEVAGSLRITASGIVLRGMGFKEGGTVIMGTGQSRETLIRVVGKLDKVMEKPMPIQEAYLPVNAMQLTLAAGHGLAKGDQINIHRPATEAWIKALGMEKFGGDNNWLGWRPGFQDIHWQRNVVAVNGNTITFDAPITMALDTAFGGGTVSRYQWPGRINQVGIENLQLVSTFNPKNKKDEDHRWMAIVLENLQDGWVRQVSFKHFAGSAVFATATAQRVTVEDCISEEPVSEIAAHRRYTFYTLGQQTLFQRIFSSEGYHDFAAGFCAPGPNAFVQCYSSLPHHYSGAIESWANGVLLDGLTVDGNALGFPNRGSAAQGTGYTAANSMIWQCAAARIDNFKPPTAQNWAIGTWSQYNGNGEWYQSDAHIQPQSLYYAQLTERLGPSVLARSFLMPAPSEASSSPSVEKAAELTALAREPIPSLRKFIEEASQRQAIPVSADGAPVIDNLVKPIIKTPAVFSPFGVSNGWLHRSGIAPSGNRMDVSWWRGNITPEGLKGTTPHITRFVPGRTGTGLTDDLDSVIAYMKNSNILAIDHNYGLWYDRRRDDHQRVRRMDADVWAPFYEQPFARSGQGTAWDGLSKYDLTLYNAFYWGRLGQFANLADQNGLLLLQQHYFQHNILEAGAHYADFPWRTANNINNTPFAEPVPYAGDKRLFLAEQFYNVENEAYRALHRAYIRKCLSNFENNTGVIHLISAEYTGPLHFVKFWLNVIGEWEKETGKNALVALSTTKDVQDAILGDASVSNIVDIIDIRYWYYQKDGQAYAPKGGQNLAPRQHARIMKSSQPDFDQVYRAVNEYRVANPSKAVIYSANLFDKMGWPIFMACGSLANLPTAIPEEFRKAAVDMKPIELPNIKVLQNEKGEQIIYLKEGINLEAKTFKSRAKLQWFNAADGKLIKQEILKAGKPLPAVSANKNDTVLWISFQ